MEYINSHPELNAEVQFGTLADYFNSVNADSKSLSLIEKKDPEHFFPTLSGDFFTYADRDDHYWSGTYLLDFLFELDMKPCMHLMDISIFSLNNVIDRLAKIMINFLEHLKIHFS